MAGYNLMDPAQLGQSIQNAFLIGAQQKALSNYAQNPNYDSATGVAGLNPELGIRLQDRERERQAAEQKAQQEMRAADLQRRAAAGDPAAKAELAGVDFQAWNALDDNQRADASQRIDAIGQAALAVSQMPPQEQPRAWDAYVGQLAQRWPELAQYQGKYSPEALQAALAQAGLIKDALGLAAPDYGAVPQGAWLVNFRDPAAVAQYNSMMGGPQGAPQQGGAPPAPAGLPITFKSLQTYLSQTKQGPEVIPEFLQRGHYIVQVQTPQQAAQLPSGTQFIAPDGTVRRVP